MHNKYVVQGRSFDESSDEEFLTLCLSIFGCALSGKDVLDDTKAFAKLLQEDNVAERLTNSLTKGMDGIKTDSDSNPWEAIDEYRTITDGLEPLGDTIPQRGDGNGTVAFIEVDGEKYLIFRRYV